MTLWILLTLLTTAVAVAIAIPMIRRIDVPPSDRDRILAVSRDQMTEIDADLARGSLAAPDAQEARDEVMRRVAGELKAAPAELQAAGPRLRLAALVVLPGWVVIAAGLLYLVLGRPDLPGQPMQQQAEAVAEVAQPAQTAAPAPAATGTTDDASKPGSVEEMIAGLSERLAANPDDAEGWRMLGWSYFNTERYTDAATAYARAVELDATRPEVWSAYGEVLVRNAGGRVTEEALRAFDAVLKLDPADPRARFFKGMALEQAGDPKAALEAWLAIAETAPADADWLPGLQQRIEELAAANNFDLGDRLATTSPAPEALGAVPAEIDAPAAGPTAEEMAAAEALSPEERQAMIKEMVDGLAARLAEDPDDPDGWVKLIRSRLVLNDTAAAQAALAQARVVFAGAPDKLAMVIEAAAALGLKEE